MKLRKIKVSAYAKINFSLNITGAENGMHTLDMVLASVDLCDTVTVCERADSTVSIEYSDVSITVGGDSVSKAARALRKRLGEFGADIYVEKRIPAAAGLGGSGVDAAAVFAAYDALYGFLEHGADASALALEVGSDVPYLLRGGFARVQGIGDRCAFLADQDACFTPLEFCLVLAKGAGGVLSKDAYAAFDGLYPDRKLCPSDNDRLIAALIGSDPAAAYPHTDNALLKPALLLNPCIQNTLRALEDSGAQRTVMTGSGAACVGFFADADQAERAARGLNGRGLWAKTVRTMARGIEMI